jgi:hypothetical protein
MNVIDFPTPSKEFKMNPVHEIRYLFEMVVDEYIPAEHKDAGEISDIRRLLDQLE